ncbi:glycosyl hydrolase family 38 protein [Necator americanus]|uniref:Glycosyl hydrolase family 38 protein n=1 Tax=Necator americanus TaxID=51031 RepID=W2TGV4_NECAM|nr:glycosyl hydrolase family 38 protein [Necator americanus]ETN81265.1 glycosyl hydrolase family 38 protein [Necator americanus]
MEMRMLRWTIGVTLKEKVSNDTVRSIFGVVPITEKMKEARLRWFGHVLRREEDSVAKTALKLDVSGVRPQASCEYVKCCFQVFAKLVLARRALSLFQHHDAVTGTAKDHVVVDYGNKMLAALDATEKVLSDALGGLISAEVGSGSGMLLDEYRKEQDALPVRRTYSIGDFVVLFNTLSRTRDEPTCIHVNSVRAMLKVDADREIKQQVSPLFTHSFGHLEPKGYELCFLDKLDPLSVSVYEVVESSANEHISLAVISAKATVKVSGFKFEPIIADALTLENSFISAHFDTVTGLLKSVTPKDHKEVVVDLHFVHYGVRPHRMLNSGGGDNRSGAYLFLPDGEAQEIPRIDQEFVVIDGPIMKKVFVIGPKDLEILQVYSLAHGSPSIEIANEVDIRSKSNFELAMRMDTSIKSGDDLFTDLNGLQVDLRASGDVSGILLYGLSFPPNFQMIRRKRQLGKLPLQAHFYPMPSSAFIEDSSTRFSLIGAQALGVASLKSGQLEVMLDRRLSQDDGRGLFQGVLDNHRTLSRFRLLVEPLAPPEEKVNLAEERVGFHSIVGLAQSMELHYPTIRMLTKAQPNAETTAGITGSLPCDVHVVNLRLKDSGSFANFIQRIVMAKQTNAGPTDYAGNGMATPKNEAVLTLYRPLTECRSKLRLQSDCTKEGNMITPRKLFPQVRSTQEVSLTLLYEREAIAEVALQPQDITSVKLSW